MSLSRDVQVQRKNERGKQGKEERKNGRREGREDRRDSEQWSADEERRRDRAALRSSKRCFVAMAAPYLWSPWERLNPVAARLCPKARGGERDRERMGERETERENMKGGWVVKKKKTVTERRI